MRASELHIRRCRRRAVVAHVVFGVAALAAGGAPWSITGCASRRVSSDDSALLKTRPEVHPQVGPPVQAKLRYVAPGAREAPEVQLLGACLARPMQREPYLPEVAHRAWQRTPEPERAGPLRDPADALVARLIDLMRAKGLAGPRNEACPQEGCPPTLLLDAVVERVELSVADRPVRPVLPVFHASVVLMDPYGRVLFQTRCELSFAVRHVNGQPRPLVPATQSLLDRAAIDCADQVASELVLAVEGKSPPAESAGGLEPRDW